jgi:asparagine N-glycosylation enzyme membrane subunit Stt3
MPSQTTSNSSASNGSKERATTTILLMLVQSIVGIGLLVVLYYTLIEAYNIRIYALKEYGLIIHEFDPYFNYRATEVSNHQIRLQICVCG